MDTWQGADDGGQVIAKEPPSVVWSKAGDGIVVVLITKDDALNGAFKFGHTGLFRLSGDWVETGTDNWYLSTELRKASREGHR